MNIEEQLMEAHDARNEREVANILAAMGDKQVEMLYDATRPVKSPRHRLYESARREMIRRGRLVAYGGGR